MINLMTVEPGQKLRLKDGTIAEVVENIGDGIWVQARRAGDSDEDLIHCEEILGAAEEE
ncbi:hypothetical protein J2W39_000120 [Variovorax paradoxus]|uniref:DUF2158 domain-containing protein n=1 Tax=Variovorax paradoxus TaxID=34073 RepID=A0AAW8E8M7_VARPD|nr:hypothetical protein [Variovorax paradoxus]MDP9968897.1 hypothetical protein [Variovorax paradoxus]